LTGDARRIRVVLALRKAGVADTRVLAAMEEIPRHLFVPDTFRDKAYDDVALPIGHHQTLSQPSVVGIMSEALEVGDRMKVLEVGTGSGYQTAVLAHLARRVYTIERHRPLMVKAEEMFAGLRLSNITTKVGDGTLGWPEQAPFARILVTAAAADVPPVLADQLDADGVMVVPVGHTEQSQIILRVRRLSDQFETEEIRQVRFVPLIPTDDS
jgi:protein-L-isoaspartate(D-aspartate) O-methyltransferase